VQEKIKPRSTKPLNFEILSNADSAGLITIDSCVESVNFIVDTSDRKRIYMAYGGRIIPIFRENVNEIQDIFDVYLGGHK
jgi:hypothetical protein